MHPFDAILRCLNVVIYVPLSERIFEESKKGVQKYTLKKYSLHLTLYKLEQSDFVRTAGTNMSDWDSQNGCWLKNTEYPTGAYTYIQITISTVNRNFLTIR